VATNQFLAEARSHLGAGETVIDAVVGDYASAAVFETRSPGVLVATDHRLVFYGRKPVGYDLETIPYGAISSISASESTTGHEVAVFAAGNEMALGGIRRPEGVAGFVSLVRERMEAG
jgi:hypothetical protein